MGKEKVLYCRNCQKKTAHRRINRDSLGKGTGLFRPIMAVVSLGVSESTISADYVCEKCGECTKSRD